MKVFYSELDANPAYYSFGYSVYGELDEADNLADCYEQGFLPFVGARLQSSRMMYQARGCRVRTDEYKEERYYRQVLRKVEEFSKGRIEVFEYAKQDFPITEEFIDFLLSYFTFRFGKGSMPKERLLALLVSPILTHIVEYRLEGKPVGYMLEVHTNNGMHFWYQAYTKKFENKHLGAYMLTDLLRRAKEQGKKYVYLGVTYGNWMKYKTNFQPLEYWNGKEWVVDPKSMQLKKLLAADGLRFLGFVDVWREAHGPYYPAPQAYTSGPKELRILITLMNATPRVFLVILIPFVLLFFILTFAMTFHIRF